MSDNGAAVRRLAAVSRAAPRRFVSPKELAAIVGRSVKSLERDRTLARGLPFYKPFGQILYDVDECIAMIQHARVEPENR